MAHVGDELRLMLTGDLQLAALLGDLVEQARVLKCDHLLVGEGLHQADDRLRELAQLAPLEDERTEGLFPSEQGNDERCTKASFDGSITQGVAWPIENIGHLQWPACCNSLTKAGLSSCDIELAISGNNVLIVPCGLSKLEPANVFAVIEYRAAVGAGEFNCTINDGLQHDLQIERRAYRPPDLAECGEIAVARLHLLEETRVLDGDDGLVCEGLQEFDFNV